MAEWEVIRRQVAIAGQVNDARTGESIGRVRVAISAAPGAFTGWLAVHASQYGERWATMAQRPDRTVTAADGHYHFLDLPDGQYTLVVSLPEWGTRYGKAQAEVDVSRNAQGHIHMAAAHIDLPPTTVKGRITFQDAEPPEKVIMATIRIMGSGEQAFSNGQGHYRLTGIETGERNVLVAAPGYQPASQGVQINEAGEERTLNFALRPVIS